MTPGPIHQQIAHSARALRRARESEINAAGRVRKGVFLPSRNGKDDDGLSVSIENAALCHSQRNICEEESGRCCVAFEVGAVRAIGLDVVSDPTEQDFTHALIIGIPNPSKSRENRELAERRAELLSKMSSRHVFNCP
jgi:hypothetical protein